LAVVVGIDEAGYGPVLGPLIVSGVGFQVRDDALTECLWDRLRDSVTRRVARRDLRLPVVDSKKLYSRKTGLGPLELSALTAVWTSGVRPASLRDLLEAVCPDVTSHLNAYPWYRDFDVDLPMVVDAARIATQTNALQRDCRAQGVEPLGICCEPLMEGHYNRLVTNTRNKAVVLLGLVLRIVERFMRRTDRRQVRICVDRQGARSHYANELLTAFEGYELQIVEESQLRSAYALRRRDVDVGIEFVTSGEDHHLPVALASIVSKYLRELFITGLNRYWQRHVKDLRPTAGYYADGQRFLTDIAAAMGRMRVSRALLVRSR